MAVIDADGPMRSGGSAVATGGGLNARKVPVMFLMAEDDVRRMPPAVAKVLKAVARAHWRTVKAALAREGRKSLTTRRTIHLTDHELRVICRALTQDLPRRTEWALRWRIERMARVERWRGALRPSNARDGAGGT
jgi:hypothetical protein